MIATINQDVPQALLDLLQEIDYTKMSTGEYRAALRDLEAYIDAKRILPRRRAAAQQTTYTLPNAVPVEAIDMINGYDYRSLKSWQVKAAIPYVRAELRRRGLLT